jgi:hypothetical protein
MIAESLDHISKQLKARNKLGIQVNRFPLTQEQVSRAIGANNRNESIILEVKRGAVVDWNSTLNYLSYLRIPFLIEDLDLTGVEAYLKTEQWFKCNNIVLESFKDNHSRLKSLLTSLFNPSQNQGHLSANKLSSFSLAELSILEFGDFIIDFIQANNITINLQAQEKTYKSSLTDRVKRQALYRNLFDSMNQGLKLKELLLPIDTEEDLEFKFKDTLKKNIGSSSLPLGSSHRNTINLHLEVLNSCDQACPGCFVKRKNDLTPNWTQEIDHFLQKGNFTEWNEVVVGPTDIFSATNFYDVFNDQDWTQGSLSKFSAITFNSTLNMPDEQIKEKFKRLKEVFPNKQLEFFIIVDIHPFLAEDPSYMSWLKNKMALLEDSNIILTINTPDVLFWRFESPGEIAYRWFNKNFKYTLSFFRSNNKKIISRYLKGMNDKCTSGTNVINYTYDKYFGGPTYTTYVYKAGQMYFAPCVVDFVFVEDPKFKLTDFNTTNDLRYEEVSGACKDCQQQASCQAKGVIAVKNHLGALNCILPSDFAAPLKTDLNL